jgi:hypothetical protein
MDSPQSIYEVLIVSKGTGSAVWEARSVVSRICCRAGRVKGDSCGAYQSEVSVEYEFEYPPPLGFVE